MPSYYKTNYKPITDELAARVLTYNLKRNWLATPVKEIAPPSITAPAPKLLYSSCGSRTKKFNFRIGRVLISWLDNKVTVNSLH